MDLEQNQDLISETIAQCELMDGDTAHPEKTFEEGVMAALKWINDEGPCPIEGIEDENDEDEDEEEEDDDLDEEDIEED